MIECNFSSRASITSLYKYDITLIGLTNIKELVIVDIVPFTVIPIISTMCS